MKAMLALLSLAAVAATVLSLAPAAGAAGSCTLKMKSFPVYMQLTGAPSGCDVVRQSAGGSLIRTYGGASGSTWCAFRGFGMVSRIVSPNRAYATFVCSNLSKTLPTQGWTKLF